jgi:hypothetical protein
MMAQIRGVLGLTWDSSIKEAASSKAGRFVSLEADDVRMNCVKRGVTGVHYLLLHTARQHQCCLQRF